LNDHVTIETLDELLQVESTARTLLQEGPRHGEMFTLWRGVKDASYELMSSLQVDLWRKHDKRDTWKCEIKEREKELVNRFLDEIEPHRELARQYRWFSPPAQRNDTFWYLSVMQHYGAPTRLVDFTADFWSALFFATDGAAEGADMLLYALRCTNEDLHDQGGNKLPRDRNGDPWRMRDGTVNINDFLGNVIGYRGFENTRFQSNSAWLNPKQRFGWDTPRFKNARIQKQKGFFVYPVDAASTLEQLLSPEPASTKYVIKANLLDAIRKELHRRKMDDWCMYLDLPRAFASFKCTSQQIGASRCEVFLAGGQSQHAQKWGQSP
jgi:hypothetical protein